MKHPMVEAARSLTLSQLAEMAAVYLPQKPFRIPCGSWNSSEAAFQGKTKFRSSPIMGCHSEDFGLK